MQNVKTIGEVNAIKNRIRTRKVADGYDVYVRGDVVPPLAESDNDVPQIVTQLQMRKAMNAFGLRSVAEKLVADSGDKDLQDDFEVSNFYRKDTRVISMATTAGLTDQQLDDLFRLADSL